MSDRDYPTCKTCKHYKPTDHGLVPYPDAGTCDSLKLWWGSGVDVEEILPDGFLVEVHEGWGLIVAAGFGCVHHQTKVVSDA